VKTHPDVVEGRATGAATPLARLPPREGPRLVASPAYLPTPATRLIGREHDLACLRALLTREGARLVTLTGAAGAGKTRLALALAADLFDDFADGAWFISLDAIQDAGLVPSAIGHTLGVPEINTRLPVDQLTDTLRRRQVLLVLDNFEQVLPAATLVAHLLSACPDLSIVVTSRASLRLSWEREYSVQPLAVPPAGWEEGVSPDAIARFPAVELFVQRARAVQPQFGLTAVNAAAVAAICRRLDGLPLAIELAAARTKVLPPPALLERLGGRNGHDALGLLTGGARDLPARHQTLRDAIAWSCALLPPAGQRLLRRLSVFRGGWTVEAAEAVCAGDGIAPVAVLDLLGDLIDQSLVVAVETEAEPRFRLLEMIREFSAEQLAAAGEVEAVQERHTACFVALAEAAEPELAGPRQAEWVRRLETEHDNFRQSLAYGIAAGNPETGLRLAAALCRFWDLRGHQREGRRWLERALAHGRGAPVRLRARALSGLATLLNVQGESAAARAPFEEALAIYQEGGDTLGQATVLNNLGNLAWSLGDYDTAHARYEESLALRRELGDPRGEAQTLHNLGNLVSTRGDHATARAYYEQSLAIKRQIEDWPGVAHSQLNLGIIAIAEGDLAAAELHFEESLAIQRALGNPQRTAQVLVCLATLRRRQGDGPAARACHIESLLLQQRVGDKQGIWLNLEGLAALAAHEGNPAHAARLLGAADAVRDEIGAVMQPLQRQGHEEHVATTRAALSDVAFAAAWTAGRALTLDQAITHALSGDRLRVPEDGAPTAPPSARAALVAAPADPVPAGAPGEFPGRLTAREAEVLALIAAGRSNKAIAAALVVSPATVHQHLINIYQKLDVHNRAAATAYAFRHGLARAATSD
jgi:non-specific serine/threonine protein kinase